MLMPTYADVMCHWSKIEAPHSDIAHDEPECMTLADIKRRPLSRLFRRAWVRLAAKLDLPKRARGKTETRRFVDCARTFNVNLIFLAVMTNPGTKPSS
jgi:hypothetical protein